MFRASTELRVATAWLVAGWLCASGLARAQTPMASRRAQEEARLNTCYRAAAEGRPGLVVDTVAQTIVRGGQVVFVDIDLPEYPELVSCLSAVILEAKLAVFPGSSPDAAGIGGRLLRFGVPAGSRPRFRDLEEVRAQNRAFIQKALASGVLTPSDPMVQAIEAPPPPWPTREQTQQLEECHRKALARHPGLALHRTVHYVARDGKLLLADILVPEDAELARCLIGRVTTWNTPAAFQKGTIVSSFWIDLGAPPAAPDAIDMAAHPLQRRNALIAEALQRGLVSADDPMIARLLTPIPDPE